MERKNINFYGNEGEIIENWNRVIDGEIDESIPTKTDDEWKMYMSRFLRHRVEDLDGKSFCAKWAYVSSKGTIVGLYVWGFRYGVRNQNGVVPIIRFTKRCSSLMELHSEMI